MSVGEAEAWAMRLAPSGMERKLRELEIWIAERDDRIAGWVPFAATFSRGYIPRPNMPGRASVQRYLTGSKG